MSKRYLMLQIHFFKSLKVKVACNGEMRSICPLFGRIALKFVKKLMHFKVVIIE